MATPPNPLLLQVNTRVQLTELSAALGRQATLDDIPDAELDRWAGQGFDWVWLLSVWQTGAAAQAISRTHRRWRREFEATLSDLEDRDIAGSGFAIRDYSVHGDLGGAAALARLRRRMRERGLKLMLDFVPNHMAPDHPWVDEHPEFFVRGSDGDLARAPRNYCRVSTRSGPMVFAHGRDPYFDGWPDTLQLDYGNPELQRAMVGELQRIAGHCDGVRCDMAMLVLPEVFERTWGTRAELFWPQAIASVRQRHPDFLFMAEVYWDLEWALHQQGFDFTYDKRLYDRLVAGHARPVREHLQADLGFQERSVRFLENHDEPRAAAAFAPAVHRAAAVITYLTPGLRFFQQGQRDGRKQRISPHLVRAPAEAPDRELQEFYDRLLTVLHKPLVRSGEWQSLDCRPAWDGNGSWDAIVAWAWRVPGGQLMAIAVNFAPHPSQCYTSLPFPELRNQAVRFEDALSSASHDRDGDDLIERGLYIDLQPWSYHVLELV